MSECAFDRKSVLIDGREGDPGQLNAHVITQAAGQETSTTSPRLFAERCVKLRAGQSLHGPPVSFSA